MGFIYSLINDGVVVYIGQTSDSVKNRVNCHISDGKLFDKVESEEVDDNLLDETESDLIMKHMPIYNKNMPRNSKMVALKPWLYKISEDIAVELAKSGLCVELGGKQVKRCIKDSDKELILTLILSGIKKNDNNTTK